MRGDTVPPSTRWQGKPDCTVGGVVKPNRMLEEPIDPYLPLNGNRGYRVSRYELELTYKVFSNRLAGKAVITAVTTESRSKFQLRPRTEPAGVKVSVNGARGTKYAHLNNKLILTPSTKIPAGGALSVTIAYSGNPEPIKEPVGRSRLGGTRRRNFGRKSAQRRGVLVPVRRPSDFQSVVPNLDHHRFPVLCPRQRQADPQADPCESDDVGLRADRTDGNLPGNHSDRSVRAPAGERRAGTGLRRSPTSAASSVRRRLRAPTPDVGGLRKAVRPYPFADYTAVVTTTNSKSPSKRRDSRSSEPTTAQADAVPNVLSHTSLPINGSATASLSGSGATSGCTKALPVTRSGSGPRIPVARPRTNSRQTPIKGSGVNLRT